MNQLDFLKQINSIDQDLNIGENWDLFPFKLDETEDILDETEDILDETISGLQILSIKLIQKPQKGDIQQKFSCISIDNCKTDIIN